MTDLKLMNGSLRQGVWQGVLAGGTAQPSVVVLHDGQPLAGTTVSADPEQVGHWIVRVALPVETLSDGVQTYVLREAASRAFVGHFTIIAGVPMEDDIRAELDLLRAELDLLKRAFRRHCVETAAQT
jgi:hypothetical protein